MMLLLTIVWCIFSSTHCARDASALEPKHLLKVIQLYDADGTWQRKLHYKLEIVETTLMVHGLVTACSEWGEPVKAFFHHKGYAQDINELHNLTKVTVRVDDLHVGVELIFKVDEEQHKSHQSSYADQTWELFCINNSYWLWIDYSAAKKLRKKTLINFEK